MPHSLVFTMASNIQTEEDKPMHPAGLDMTRGSLHDILDGNEVNVSTALPSVPQDTTNPFINPNQALADVIPGRDLGPLSSLKITDADLIIRNLNKELNAATEKNDNSVALLQRMDQRQKQLEAELATLRAEKEAAIQERQDHTINQDRLAETLHHNLEKEYADKEQNYLRQLKQELKSKTSAIRDQCKMEFDQELKTLKEEWSQERLKTNEQHNAQISMVLKEIDALKEHSRMQQKAEVEAGDKIPELKTTAFNFVPSTVMKNEDAPPIPPRKHVHFTSTPRHPVQSNLFDSDDENPITGHPGNPFISNPGNPFTQQQVRGNVPAQTTVDTDATTIIGNTMSAVASEFKKMREPKLAKLKGGVTSGASLFFNSWVKDVRSVIQERSMSNTESLQLVKDYTEGRARQQVEFYIVSTTNPTIEGLIENLKTSFQSGEQMGTLGKNGAWGDATCTCPRTCVPRPCSSLCMVTRVLALQVWLSSCLVVSGREDLSLHSVGSIQAADDYSNYTWDSLTLNLFCSTTFIVIHITAASFHFFLQPLSLAITPTI